MAGAASAVVVGVIACAGSGAAQAATISGDTFDISYYYPNRTTLYVDLGTYTDPATISAPRDPKGVGKLGPYSIRYVFGQTVHFTPAAFDGVVFTDETAARIAYVALNRSTNAAGLTASDLTFTSNSISLDLSDVTVQAGSIIQIDIAAYATPRAGAKFAALAVPSVPLPATAPMFGAALLALAGLGCGLGRRAVRTEMPPTRV